MTSRWRTMTASWRLPKWPRRFPYPTAGLVLPVGMMAGLLVVEAATLRRMPTISWILAELHARPLAYAYLLVATLGLMTTLGRILGRQGDTRGRASATSP